VCALTRREQLLLLTLTTNSTVLPPPPPTLITPTTPTPTTRLHSPSFVSWQWSWKDVRTHFLLHCSDTLISRTFTIKSLQTARYTVESKLIRVSDGERDIDKAGCELMLKLIKEESNQRQLLGVGMGSGGSKRQPGGATVGDAK
jgi:hypothetical protein